MNVRIWGDSPLRESVAAALQAAGHSLSFGDSDLTGIETLIALPTDDLERATRGTYELFCAAARAKVERCVVVSPLAFFRRLPQNWQLTPWWRPRPDTSPAEMCAYLREISAREIGRSTGLHICCVRLGDVPAEEAVQAIVEALAQPRREDRQYDWTITHVGDATGRPAPDPRPWQEVLAAPEPVPARAVRRVTIFGACGPLGAALARELAPHYALCLTDARPIEEVIRENKPQKLGAPLPEMPDDLPLPPGGRHESRVVDVRDGAAVSAACAGSNAIINCSVLRHDPIDAFRVNTLGAYNIALAAVEQRIRRVVQTGPEQLTIAGGRGDYLSDYEIAGDAPGRPGCHLYGHSKYLGQEILRIFAEWHDLEVPNLLFSKFANAEIGSGFYPMLVTWKDAARALRAALEVESLPSPYEEFHVTIPLPHGRFRSDKLERLLGWMPQEQLDRFWQSET